MENIRNWEKGNGSTIYIFSVAEEKIETTSKGNAWRDNDGEFSRIETWPESLKKITKKCLKRYWWRIFLELKADRSNPDLKKSLREPMTQQILRIKEKNL